MARNIKGWPSRNFLENVDFEKYAEFVMDYPILFIKKMINIYLVKIINFLII